MILILFATISALVNASPHGVPTPSLDGKRVYLRVWDESDALDYAKSEHHDLPRLLSRSSESVEVTPDLMALTIHAEDGSHVTGMLLQRNTRIQHPLTLQVGEVDQVIQLAGENEAQYQDSLSSAVFGMRHIQGQRHFDGAFHHDGVSYELHPAEKNGSDRERGLHNHRPHMISKARKYQYADSIDLLDDVKMTTSSQIEQKDPEEQRYVRYDVEFAIAVDYSEYLRWYTQTGSQAGAIEALKYKFSYTYNGMDMIYRSVRKTSSLAIVIWLMKVQIQTDPRQSAVSELYSYNIDPSTGPKTTIDAGRVLEYEEKWKVKHGMQKYDHLMYWVGYNIAFHGNPGTLGLATVASVCEPRGNSLIEDLGFGTFRTASHELAHGLGSMHDVEQSGDCASDREHIMAPWEGIPDEKSNSDGWHFSTCSIQQFRKTLADKECVVRNDLDITFMPVPIHPLPGARYDADWQCRWANMGSGADDWHHCQGKEAVAEECYMGLRCGGGGVYCMWKGHVRPADGTPCTGHRRCLDGKCQ